MTSKTEKDTEDTGGKMWVNPQAKKKKRLCYYTSSWPQSHQRDQVASKIWALIACRKIDLQTYYRF